MQSMIYHYSETCNYVGLKTTYCSKVAFGGGAGREDKAVLIKNKFPAQLLVREKPSLVFSSHITVEPNATRKMVI